MSKHRMLIVDDVEINREIMACHFDDYEIVMAGNGQEALDRIIECNYDIDIILLDIMMPVMNGFEFLEKRAENLLIARIPVVMVTGEDSNDTDLEKNSFQYDISDFVRKPINPHVVKRRVGNIVRLHDYEKELEHKVISQEDEINDYIKQLHEMNNNLIESISNIVESRNLESGMHVKRVKTFVNCLTKYVQQHYLEYNITDEDVEMFTVTSAMHDIGKIVIPDAILLKPGRFTDEEFEQMKQHTVAGGKIIEQSVDFKDTKYSKCAYEITRWHHERFDGRGYPDKLVGEEIPIAAQITGVCDCFDALVSERCYKKAFDYDTAYEMITSGQCGTFSEKMMTSFLAVREDFYRIASELIETKENA